MRRLFVFIFVYIVSCHSYCQDEQYFSDAIVDSLATKGKKPHVLDKLYIAGSLAYCLEEHDKNLLFDRDDMGYCGLYTEMHGEKVVSVTSNIDMHFGVEIEGDLDGARAANQGYSDTSFDLSVLDFYLEYTRSQDFLLRVGHQLYPLGYSENYIVSDVINPRDYRRPGLSDFDKSRVYVDSISLDWFRSNFKASGVFVKGDYSHRYADARSDFYPWIQFSPGTPIRKVEIDSKAEVFARVEYIGRGFDLAYMYGEHFKNDLDVFYDEVEDSLVLSQGRESIHAINAVWGVGDFVVSFEGAVKTGISSTSETENHQFVGDRKINYLMKVDYRPSADLYLSLEYFDEKYFGDNLSDIRYYDDSVYSLYIMADAYNDSIKLLLQSTDLVRGGSLQSGQVRYLGSDEFEVSIKLSKFSASKNDVFYHYRNNDVVDLSFKWYLM